MPKVNIGRLLTITVLLTALTVLIFWLFRPMLSHLDADILTWATNIRTPFGIGFFGAITWLGKWYIVMALSAGLCIGFRQNSRFRQFCTPLLILLLGVSSSTYALKELFHRVRPGAMLPTFVEETFSFPSGHAAIAMALYGFLLFLVLKTIKQGMTRSILSFCCIALIFLIGFSRIYLGVHFFTDVWGGYLVGLWWVIIAIFSTEMALFKRKY